MRRKVNMRNRNVWMAIVVVVMLSIGAYYSVARGATGNLTANGNKHNLSASGTGAYRSSEQQICVFCHTPHMSLTEGPLWNHSLTIQASYTMPTPLTTQLTTPLNPPDEASRLCLSCHDGTVPLGSVQNLGGASTVISMTGGVGLGPLPAGSTAYLGTDLSGHHLISIEINNQLVTDKAAQCPSVSYKLNSGIAYPYLQPTRSSYPCDRVANPNGCKDNVTMRHGVQCNSCHDPHLDPVPGVTKFIRGASGAPSTQAGWPWTFGDTLCCQCHVSCTGTCP